MNQMRQAMGENPGQQPGGMQVGNGRRDPLGRPQQHNEEGLDTDSNVQIPDEIDIQRARRILEAIRERLGDAFRPEMERHYLERLLNNR